METILSQVDKKIFDKFEKNIIEVLSICLINSASDQGLIDSKMRDYIISKI